MNERLEALLIRIQSSSTIGNVAALLFRERIPNWGVRIATDFEEIQPPVKAMLLSGLYERAEIRFIKKYLNPDRDVLELGSSIGVSTCHIARRLAPQRRIVCVEADARLMKVMKANVTLNAPGSEVAFIQGAIAYPPDGDRFVDFRPSSMSTEGAILGQDASNIAGPVHSVPVVSLSKIIGDYDLTDFSLVCDIEGAEAGIIAHEFHALKRCSQLIIELHDTVLDGVRVCVEEMLSTLTGLYAFDVVDVRGPVFVLERRKSSRTA